MYRCDRNLFACVDDHCEVTTLTTIDRAITRPWEKALFHCYRARTDNDDTPTAPNRYRTEVGRYLGRPSTSWFSSLTSHYSRIHYHSWTRQLQQLPHLCRFYCSYSSSASSNDYNFVCLHKNKSQGTRFCYFLIDFFSFLLMQKLDVPSPFFTVIAPSHSWLTSCLPRRNWK